jgi:DNA-binding PadR family transcriptional regulator
MPSSRFPIPQGTLDMLILQILSLEPAHGYGCAATGADPHRRSSQPGSLYPVPRLNRAVAGRVEALKQAEAKFYS